jgi:hypothetical protein
LRVDADANSALFRTALQCRRLRFGPDLIAPGSNQLCKRRHGSPSIELKFAFHIAVFREAVCQWSSSEAKVQLRSRNTRQETPHYYQQSQHFIWSKQRGLLGFAGLAPHSGRSSHPDPSFFVPGSEDLPFHQQGKTSLTKA